MRLYRQTCAAEIKKSPPTVAAGEDIPKTDYIFIYQPLVAKAVMTPLKADKFKIKQKKRQETASLAVRYIQMD